MTCNAVGELARWTKNEDTVHSLRAGMCVVCVGTYKESLKEEGKKRTSEIKDLMRRSEKSWQERTTAGETTAGATDRGMEGAT
jgi:aminopeptidase-like protein